MRPAPKPKAKLSRAKRKKLKNAGTAVVVYTSQNPEITNKIKTVVPTPPINISRPPAPTRPTFTSNIFNDYFEVPKESFTLNQILTAFSGYEAGKFDIPNPSDATGIKTPTGLHQGKVEIIHSPFAVDPASHSNPASFLNTVSVEAFPNLDFRTHSPTIEMPQTAASSSNLLVLDKPVESGPLTLDMPEALVEPVTMPDEAKSQPPTTGQSLEKPLEVMLITEGTYPFHWGGVSTWCHLLIRDLPEVNFTLFGLVSSPNLEPQLNLLPNVVDFRSVPLWGIREVLELGTGPTLGKLYRSKKQAEEKTIQAEFVPVLRGLLSDLYLSNSEPERLGNYIHQMYRFFLTHDFDTVMRSQAVWNCFVEAARHDFPRSAALHGFSDVKFTVKDIIQGLHWFYHWFFPLARPVPRVDVAHASTAGISTLVGVVAKLEYGAAFLLSEHGIYLRERYLAEAATSQELFLKLFTLRFARRMTDLSYAMCDQISPCCDYNQRWEIQNGASMDRLRTIYYGADADKFYAGGKPFGDPPVVVWVGRINPLKDLFTLLEAAALVHKERPDIEFRLYGNPPAEDLGYYEDCLALHNKLGLENVVNFAGYSSNAAVAYNEGDVVLLSSISEGFPFATLEAMLCGKPVVATSVGGLPEQIEGCGLVVEPANPREMARAILTLMNDPALSSEYGKSAREKALEEFSVHQSREAYLGSYLRLTGRAGREIIDNPTSMEEPEADAVNPPLFGGEDKAGYSQDFTTDLAGPGRSKIRRRLQTLKAQNRSGWLLSDEEAARILARAVMERDAQPLDYLEVGALIESMGITDEMAFQRFGAPDTFELARVVLILIRARAGLNQAEDSNAGPVSFETNPDTKNPTRYHRRTLTAGKPVAHRLFKERSLKRAIKGKRLIKGSGAGADSTIKPARAIREKLFHYSAGIIALLPGLVIVFIIQFYTYLGGFTGEKTMALSLGLSAGLLLSSSFIQAILRRTSICLSLGNPRAATRFLIRSTGFGSVGMLSVALLAFLISGLTVDFSLEARITFSLAFGGLSLIWLAGGPLGLLQRQVWLGIGLAFGLLAFIGTDRLTALFTNSHLIFGSIAGFASALSLIIYKGTYRLSVRGKNSDPGGEDLPSTPYLLYEAAPYLGYGLLYTFFITAPHLMGWFGNLNFNTTRQQAITSLEVGFTLALPPLVLAGGVTERSVRLFWKKLAVLQAITAGDDIASFNRNILGFYNQQRERYEIVLSIFSLILGGCLWWAIQNNGLVGLIGSGTADTSIFLLFGLVTYYMTGQGLFNCAFFLTLARPGLALRSVLVSLVPVLGLGLPFSLFLDFRFSLVGFVLGALVFMFTSSRTLRRLLLAADYHYFTAF